MSILDLAKNILNKANEIVGSTSDNKPESAQRAIIASQSAKPNSIHVTNNEVTSNVGDIVTISDAASSVQINNGEHTTVTQRDIDAKFKSIKTKCEKLGITLEEAKKYINIEMVNYITTNANIQLEKQLMVLNCIDAALSEQINRPIQADINKSEYTGIVAQNYFDAIENGGVSDIKAFQQIINEEMAPALNEYESAETQEERAQALDKARQGFNARIDTECEAECVGKSRTEQVRIIQKYENRRISLQRGAQHHFNSRVKPENRPDGVHLRNSEHWAESHAYAKLYTDPETRKNIAGSFSHEYEVEAMRLKSRFGDAVSAEQYGKAIAENLPDMSAEDATKFEQDAYEYRLKVERGEIDAPWMTPEHFKAESVGIGVGITNNGNLSDDEKASLLNTWDRHASEFSDYYEVKSAYNTAMSAATSENPNLAQTYENVKNIISEKYNNNLEQLPRAWEKRQEEQKEIKTKATEHVLKAELKTKTVAEIKKSYSNSMHDIAKIILENDVEYKNRIDDIIDYLNCFSGKEIGLMAVGCSTPTISKLIQKLPEKAHQILDIVAPSMCFTGRQVVENIIKEGNNNEAA